MPSIEDQLAEVYATVDELHDIEVRLRAAVEQARATLSGDNEPNDIRPG